MKQLPNNCRLGNFSISPVNWKHANASLKKAWRIMYWFYDDNLRQRKKVMIMGMNQFETVAERQDAIRVLMADEEDLLIRQGYNPFTKTFCPVNESDISEYTALGHALDFAFQNMKVSANTKIDMQSVLSYVKRAADQLGFSTFRISEIKRKHLKFILKKCGELKDGKEFTRNGRTYIGRWTANTYNHYRKYLSILFSVLVEFDAIEYNPVQYIKKEHQLQRIRETLTDNRSERVRINEYLRIYYFNFWRFMQVFFHSGVRITELLKVKASDVDLAMQRFKVIINKGRRSREVWRPIKDVAVDHWKDLLSTAGPDHYIFSSGLVPGEKAIRREQITRRWREHVKKKLGITADFYSLKHTNLDEIAAELSLKDAQAMAGHTTPVITLSYTTGEKGRQDDRLRKVSNSFA